MILAHLPDVTATLKNFSLLSFLKGKDSRLLGLPYCVCACVRADSRPDTSEKETYVIIGILNTFTQFDLSSQWRLWFDTYISSE